MGKCLSKSSSSSSSPSSSSGSAVDEETTEATATILLAKATSPQQCQRVKGHKKRVTFFSSKQSKLFATKRLTEDTEKSLEQPRCQTTSLYKTSSGGTHGSRVRPAEPDHIVAAKVTTRVLLDESLNDQSHNNQSKQSEKLTLVVNTSSFLDSSSSPETFLPASSTTTSSPLRRLNDLKLEKKMLRDRFFSADDDKAGVGQEFKNGFTSPVKPVLPAIASATVSPAAKNLSPSPRVKQHNPQPHSFIPRPSGPVVSSTATNGERVVVQTAKVQSGIPRLYSPLSSRGGPGQRGQLPIPISMSSHQRETEEVNRFRVDSSYVVNKSGGVGLRQEKMVGVPNRPASAIIAQGRGAERKSMPMRSLQPYKSNGHRLSGPNKYLVKKPEVTRPFYTMMYQNSTGVGKKGDVKPQAANNKGTPLTGSVSRTVLDKPSRDDGLILRSVTWTKEDDKNILLSVQVQEPLNYHESFEEEDKSQTSSANNKQPSTTPESALRSRTKTKFPVPQIPINPNEASVTATSTTVSDCKTSSSTSHQVSHSLEVTSVTSTSSTSTSSAVSTVSPKVVPRSRPTSQTNYPGSNNSNNPSPQTQLTHHHIGQRLSPEKLYHSSTNSSVLSSNDNNEMSSDSDYNFLDDEIEDQPDLITTTTTLKTDNNSFQLASNIGSSLESLQIESDYSDDDLHHRHKDNNRIDLSGLLAQDGEGQLELSAIISTTDSCEEEGLDKIEVISLHSDDTSNTSEKVDDVKSEVCSVNASKSANNTTGVNSNTALKTDTKVKRRISAAARGTPTNKMVLDRTMSYELRSSHRSVAPPKKAVELPKHSKYPGGTKNGTLTTFNQEDARKTNEDLLREVQDLKRTLFQLKTVLEEQNRREKEKDETINKLLREVDILKKCRDCRNADSETVEIKDSLKPEDHRKVIEDIVDDTLIAKAVSRSEAHHHHHSHHSIAKSVIKKS